MSSASSAKGKGKEKAGASLLAGATAGGFEAFATYPFESIKTRVQFTAAEQGQVSASDQRQGLPVKLGLTGLSSMQTLSPFRVFRDTLSEKGVRGLYAGTTAVVIGNAVKAGVRFTTYDQFKSMLKDDEVGRRVDALFASPSSHSWCMVHGGKLMQVYRGN